MNLRVFVVVFGIAALMAADVLVGGASGIARAQSLGAATPQATAKRSDLPASDELAKATLDRSPRHGEWINILEGLQITRTYIVHPSRGGRSPILLVVSDNRGMSDWIRAAADQFAQEGFTVLVPDMLSGAGPNGGNTESFDSPDAVARAIGQLSSEQVMRRLEGVWNYGMRLPGLTGKGAVVGFDWGGVHSFTFAAATPDTGAVSAAVVFDGLAPTAATIAKINVPVLGFYTGDAAFIAATVDATAAEMKRLGKSYETTVFQGAARGFVHAQTTSAANLDATEQAWPKAVAFLKQHTK